MGANHNTRAAIYARVSSEQQEKEGTIESQLEALYQRLQEEQHISTGLQG